MAYITVFIIKNQMKTYLDSVQGKTKNQAVWFYSN